VRSDKQTNPLWPVSHVEQHLGSSVLPEPALIGYLQHNGPGEWLRKWKLHGTSGLATNKSTLLSAYKVSDFLLYGTY